MAQLIKLQDFISRYETDIFRYPSQYIRLKKDRWEKIQAASIHDEILDYQESLFENIGNEYQQLEGFEEFDDNWLESEKKGVFGKIKNWFKKSKNNNNLNEEDYFEASFNESTDYSFDRNITKEELKQQFLDEIFRFQVNWASSTIRDRSYIDEDILEDDVLKYFLQHFPDNYLLLYKPTLMIKKAPIDLDIIMISPIFTFCISILESDEMSVYKRDRGRYWFENLSEKEVKRINPMPSLNRTETLVKSIYKNYDVEMPVKKVVLSRTGYIEGDYIPLNTLFIDKRNYSDWYSKLRRLPAPLKFVQLKGAQSLLKHSRSTYVRRYEWEQEEEHEEIIYEDESR